MTDHKESGHMKNLILTCLLLSTSGQAAILNDVRSFIGRTGQGMEYGNEIGPCKVAVEEGKLILKGDYYFSSFIELSAKLIKQTATSTSYLSSATGKRPGGDKCGDQGGMINYRKTAIIDHAEDLISIKESFRCMFDGLKRYSIEYLCQL
jgi:hypothetical protein